MRSSRSDLDGMGCRVECWVFGEQASVELVSSVGVLVAIGIAEVLQRAWPLDVDELVRAGEHTFPECPGAVDVPRLAQMDAFDAQVLRAVVVAGARESALELRLAGRQPVRGAVPLVGQLITGSLLDVAGRQQSA
jgi:hypothetical protein